MTMKFATKPLLALVAVAALVGCTTQDTDDNLAVEVEENSLTMEGVPGGITQRTATMTAVVIAIDYEQRIATLKDSMGTRKTISVGPEVTNFDNIEKGDQVNIEYIEEMVIFLKGLGLPNEDGTGVIAARAPEGSKPAAAVAGVVELTAVVEAIDVVNRTATLKFSDGETQVVPVREDIELKQEQVGREVVIRTTTALAVTVEAVDP